MYQVAFEYLEQFVSYGPWLNNVDDAYDEDADDDNANGITIARPILFRKTDELGMTHYQQSVGNFVSFASNIRFYTK